MTFEPEPESGGEEHSRANAPRADPSDGDHGTASDSDTSRRPLEFPTEDFGAVSKRDDDAPMWLVAPLERGEPLSQAPAPTPNIQGPAPFPAGPAWKESATRSGAHNARRRISKIVVLVLVVAVVAVGGRLAFGALAATPDDYTAPPISRQDVAADGGLMWISQTGKSALEVDPTWTNKASVESGDVPGLYPHEVTVYASTWTLPGGAGTVRMFDAVDPQASNVTLTAMHESAVSSASKFVMSDMGDGTQVAPTIPHGVATSTGLHGRVSDLAWNASGSNGTVTVYTFVHAGRTVILQVTLIGNPGALPSVERAVNTLRIDR